MCVFRFILKTLGTMEIKKTRSHILRTTLQHYELWDMPHYSFKQCPCHLDRRRTGKSPTGLPRCLMVHSNIEIAFKSAVKPTSFHKNILCLLPIANFIQTV